MKYLVEDWSATETELMRERGLWGPPIGSPLDKWMLDMTEGPHRMRKKMMRNDMFYINYPYKDPDSNVSFDLTSDVVCKLFHNFVS